MTSSSAASADMSGSRLPGGLRRSWSGGSPPVASQSMRVAVDATPLIGPRTGIGRFVEALLPALDRRGHGRPAVRHEPPGRSGHSRRARSGSACRRPWRCGRGAGVGRRSRQLLPERRGDPRHEPDRPADCAHGRHGQRLLVRDRARALLADCRLVRSGGAACCRERRVDPRHLRARRGASPSAVRDRQGRRRATRAAPPRSRRQRQRPTGAVGRRDRHARAAQELPEAGARVQGGRSS